MLVTTLTTTYLYGLGGGARRAVMTVIGLGLLGEAHHLLRAAMTLHANSGVWTAAPMPIVGAWILFSIARAPRGSTLSPALS